MGVQKLDSFNYVQWNHLARVTELSAPFAEFIWLTHNHK